MGHENTSYSSETSLIRNAQQYTIGVCKGEKITKNHPLELLTISTQLHLSECADSARLNLGRDCINPNNKWREDASLPSGKSLSTVSVLASVQVLTPHLETNLAYPHPSSFSILVRPFFHACKELAAGCVCTHIICVRRFSAEDGPKDPRLLGHGA